MRSKPSPTVSPARKRTWMPSAITAELVRGEGAVPAQVGHRAAGPLRVDVEQLVERRIAGGRVDRAGQRSPERPGEHRCPSRERTCRGRPAGRRGSPSPSPGSRRCAAAHPRRRRGRCRGGSRRARSRCGPARERPPRASCSASSSGSARETRCVELAAPGRSCRSRYPSGRPKSASPTAAGRSRAGRPGCWTSSTLSGRRPAAVNAAFCRGGDTMPGRAPSPRRWCR